MSIDLTGITNKNEYYTNHYFSTIFEENAGEAITAWAQAAKSSEEIRTPWHSCDKTPDSSIPCTTATQAVH